MNDLLKELATVIGNRLDELSNWLSRIESRLRPIEEEREQLFHTEAKRRLGLEKINYGMACESRERTTRQLTRIVEQAPQSIPQDKE